MKMQTILNSILSLFLMLAAGIYGRKKEIITQKVNKGLTDILLEIGLPCMIISSFSFSYDNTVKVNVFKAFYYSLGAYILIALASYILLMPVKGEKKIILHFANIFTNTGYIGFPILNLIYGGEAVVYGSVFNTFFVLFLWTYGIMFFKGSIPRKELKHEVIKALLNPSVIAVYIGIAMMLFDFKLPAAVMSSFKSIGSITAPLSMMIVGAMCSDMSIKEHLRDWTIYYGIGVKIIFLPLLLYLVSLIIQNRSIVLNSIIIIASMPPAAMTSIFAETFNVKKDYASVILIASTLLSIFTLPLLLKILL